MKRNPHIATFVLVVLLCVALATSLVGAQDSMPRFWLSFDLTEATAGEEFTVTVNVADAVAVYGGSFQLMYDPQAFEVVLVDSKAITPGSFFDIGSSFALKNSADSVAGTVDYALTMTQPAQPVTGEGVLGTVTFRALKDGPVTITPVSAKLVAPEFTEVEGRLIAQKINQVEAEISDTIVGGEAVVVEQLVDELPEVDLSPDSASVGSSTVSSASVSSVQAPVLMEERRGNSNNKMLVVAGLFFIGGLLLLTVSVGMYSKMRVGFSLAGDHRPERML